MNNHQSPTTGLRFPGEKDLWIFVLGDMITFTMFFVYFMYERSLDVAGFQQAHSHVSVGLGLVNSIILITSSWLVAVGLAYARNQELAQARSRFQMATALGLGFCILKIFEYISEVKSGFAVMGSGYFLSYFSFAGVHFIHVVIGIFSLRMIIKRLGEVSKLDGRDLLFIESTSVYWHMVDLLWIFLFLVLYLIR